MTINVGNVRHGELGAIHKPYPDPPKMSRDRTRYRIEIAYWNYQGIANVELFEVETSTPARAIKQAVTRAESTYRDRVCIGSNITNVRVVF